MIIVLVTAFVLGISPAYAGLLWGMKRLTEPEHGLTGARGFVASPRKALAAPRPFTQG